MCVHLRVYALWSLARGAYQWHCRHKEKERMLAPRTLVSSDQQGMLFYMHLSVPVSPDTESTALSPLKHSGTPLPLSLSDISIPHHPFRAPDEIADTLQDTSYGSRCFPLSEGLAAVSFACLFVSTRPGPTHAIDTHSTSILRYSARREVAQTYTFRSGLHSADSPYCTQAASVSTFEQYALSTSLRS